MIRFHQTFGAHTGRTFSFEKALITFGRMPDCDVPFDPHADIDASGNHAEVRREAVGYVVMDSGSRNGTYVNGQRISQQVLSHGDEIEFGPGGPRLKVELVSGAHTGPLPSQQAPSQPPPALSAPPTAAPVPNPSGSTPGSGDPSSGRRYGQKTVAMMIQSAVVQSQQAQDQGNVRSTAFLRAVAHEAANHSSRGLKIALAMLTLLFLGSLVVIAGLIFWSWQQNQRETERLSEQVQSGPAGERIANENRAAIFMLVEHRGGQERGICTAFAVRPNLLGTNAHCVHAMEAGRAEGKVYFAVQNEAPQTRIPIGQSTAHPSYSRSSPNPSADVGLVSLIGQASSVVRLSADAPQSLGTGEQVYVFGFPGNLSDVRSPVATITDGVVGRMTRFDGTRGDAVSNQLIQHSAFTTPGTSGSPIFNQEGEVIAVNAGAFRAAAQQDIVGNGERQQQTVVTDTGYKFGIRIDVLNGLLTSTAAPSP